MLNRKLICLGKLSEEMKQATWSKSISGSQAWSLFKEPYNLIRDKLDKPHVFPSKYDYLDKSSVARNAMKQGQHYEEAVFNELREHDEYKQAIREDYTYRLVLFDESGNEIPLFITSTPDWYIKDGEEFIRVGDIKNTTQAENETYIFDTYYYQMLHNAYVLNCSQAEINAKGYTSRGVNTYKIPTFTQEQFEDYERRLLKFATNLQFQIENAYDNLYKTPENIVKTTDEVVLREPVTRDAEPMEAQLIENYLQDKEELNRLKKRVEAFEKQYKDDFDTLVINLPDNKAFILKTTIVKGSYDYAQMIEDFKDRYGITQADLDEYKKEPTLRKAISVK